LKKMPAIPTLEQSSKIDLKQLSKRLADINLTNKPTSTIKTEKVPVETSKSEAYPSTNSNYETEMINSLKQQSEHLIDSREWPAWQDFFAKLNQSSQFRQLLFFHINSHYILVRESHSTASDSAGYQHIRELRVAVIGNVDAGKSTVLGVLSRGGLDDGRGRARIYCARHRHESETGRTSSVSQELLGYSIDGKHISDDRISTSADPLDEAAYLHKHQKMTWEIKIGRDSWKCISMIDLAGHEKYLKTTMFGLTGYCPDIAMLMVGANTGGLIGTSKEHLALAAALSIPTIVVVTKIDLAPEGVRSATIAHINKILKSATCKKMPLMIRSIDDIVHLIKSGLFAANQICPIFEVSNVTGQGIDILRLFFNLARVPDAIRERWEANLSEPVEYQINETYIVPGVGTVVSGVITAGSIKVGDPLLLGPTDNHGRFIPTVVRGIQRKRINLPVGIAGQAVSLALKKIKRSEIRYGMALISPSAYNPPPPPLNDSRSRVCREFTAQVIILYHSTTITPKYQAMLHCGTIRQTVQIVSMALDSDEDASTAAPTQIGRTGDRARIRFRFLKQPEMLRTGTKILFREGRTRGIGKIIELHQ
jgi:GTPase